jgi:hypothetical protein
LTGAGFSPPVEVRFGATEAPILAQSDASATVLTPPSDAGPVTVTLTNSDGQVSNGLTFTYQAGSPPPVVGSVIPAIGPASGGKTVSIAGSRFSATPAVPRVKFGDEFAAVISSSTTLIVATLPANVAGEVSVTVTNPDAQAGTLPSAFTYLASPKVISISSTSGSTGGGDLVTLTGSSFDVATAPVVTFGGTPAVVMTGFTATAMTALTPAHGEGVVDVTVINADGQGSSVANGFTFKSPAPNAPTVASIRNSATGLPSGAVEGGEAVTIAGSNFAPGARVNFGAAPASGVTFVSTTELTAITPFAQAAGAVDVTVVLPGTGLAGSIPLGFTYLLPAPRVTTLSVVGSPPGGGGFLLVKGLNLLATSTVTFGGSPAPVSAFAPGIPPGGDLLTVVVPPSPLGPADDGFVSVAVQNPDGQSSTFPPSTSADGTPWPANFHYGSPPLVTGFTPGAGRGIDVILTGTGFSADTSGARFGIEVLLSGPSSAILQARRCPNAADSACLPGAVSPTPTTLVVNTPPDLLPGRYGFVVTNFDGQSAMAPGAFVIP